MAVALLTLPASHLAQLEPPAGCCGGFRFEVATPGGPGNETWCGEIVQAEPARAGWRGLRAVGGDEFQVHGRSQSDECVVRALTWMPAAQSRADPGERLEAVDLLVQVLPAPDEVIDWRQGAKGRRSEHAS